MARRGIRKKDYENLDDPTVSRVISLLEADNPITKKAACEILNISYSTQRLSRIIQEYKDKIEYRKKRLKANRGQPYSELEIKELVVDYLSGKSITKISKSLFRSIQSVKRKIEELNLPERDKNQTYQKPGLTPDNTISNEFTPGQLVWSARYNTVAEIIKLYNTDDLGNNIYSIYLFGNHEQRAYQPAYELAKLDVLDNISKEQFQTTERPNFSYRID